MQPRLLLPVMAVVLTVCAAAVPKRKHPTKAGHRIVSAAAGHKRAFCDDDEFECDQYECVQFKDVCDTAKDCTNGKDEENCPTDCSGPHQFQCEADGKCISHQLRCDDRVDCTDWSDEAGCAEYECLDGFAHCLTSNTCVRENYICDGFADCKDGSDESTCTTDGTCAPDEVTCAKGGKCLRKSDVCDGFEDCYDGSDEDNCVCTSDQFTCSNGRCITGYYKCDNNDDCGDASDELNCPSIPEGECRDLMPVLDCHFMNTTSHPICTRADSGYKYCRKFCGLCPK